jgi:hypothetical protein
MYNILFCAGTWVFQGWRISVTLPDYVHNIDVLQGLGLSPILTYPDNLTLDSTLAVMSCYNITDMTDSHCESLE